MCSACAESASATVRWTTSQFEALAGVTVTRMPSGSARAPRLVTNALITPARTRRFRTALMSPPSVIGRRRAARPINDAIGSMAAILEREMLRQAVALRVAARALNPPSYVDAIPRRTGPASGRTRRLVGPRERVARKDCRRREPRARSPQSPGSPAERAQDGQAESSIAADVDEVFEAALAYQGEFAHAAKAGTDAGYRLVLLGAERMERSLAALRTVLQSANPSASGRNRGVSRRRPKVRRRATGRAGEQTPI